MIFRFLENDEIETVYPKIFEKCFGKNDPFQAPSVVGTCVDDGKIVAFMSGYFTNKIEFYIQYGSIMPEYRNNKKGIEYLRFAVENISNLGARFYITMIPNDNIHAMKIVLDCGFRLIGVRQPTSGILLGEWLKEVNYE